MTLSTPSRAIDQVRVVGDLEELFADAAAHPRELLLLREEAPPSRERVRECALRFGAIVEARGFGELRSIHHDPEATHSTAMSLRELPFHTDGTFLQWPPPRIMMCCVASDQGGGGVSTFYPLERLLGAMPGWVVDALRAGEFRFPQGYDGDLTNSWVAPVLDHDLARIRWRSDDLFKPPAVRGGALADDAVRWLHEHLIGNQPLTYACQPGETILVPNEVMLHGRTALTPGSRRHLLRVWVA